MLVTYKIDGVSIVRGGAKDLWDGAWVRGKIADSPCIIVATDEPDQFDDPALAQAPMWMDSWFRAAVFNELSRLGLLGSGRKKDRLELKEKIESMPKEDALAYLRGARINRDVDVAAAFEQEDVEL
jgi:hypothetical protein